MTSRNLRLGRSSEAGRYYAVTIVTCDRRPLFRKQLSAAAVVAEIDFCVQLGDVESCAWVLMPDHLHWLFRLDVDDLSRCMQAFKSRSARRINQALGAQGTIWKHGFHDHRLRGDEDLHAQARYIVANPLRRGLVGNIGHYPYWWCRWIKRQEDL